MLITVRTLCYSSELPLTISASSTLSFVFHLAPLAHIMACNVSKAQNFDENLDEMKFKGLGTKCCGVRSSCVSILKIELRSSVFS